MRCLCCQYDFGSLMSIEHDGSCGAILIMDGSALSLTLTDIGNKSRTKEILIYYCPICGRRLSVGNDNINHPKHYNHGRIEVIEAIEDWGLNYHLGNAMKYIGRAAHKGSYEADIQKAIWYLQRDLENRKNQDRKGETAS